MTRAEVQYYEREQRELVRINFVEPVSCPMAAGFGGEHRDMALSHIGYFAELIDEWAPEAHADERLFRLGSSITDALAAGAPVERLARYFEYWILRLQGVYPALTACPGCGGAFDGHAVMPPQGHLFVCRRCAPGTSGTAIGRAAFTFLKGAAAASPDRLNGLALPASAARELETAHRRLLNVHLEKELKSARVLREMRRPGS